MEALHSFSCDFEKWGCCRFCNERGPRPNPVWAGPCFVCRKPLLDRDNLIVKCGVCKQLYHNTCQGFSRDQAIASEFTVECQKCTYNLPPRIWSKEQYLKMDPEDQEFYKNLYKRINQNKLNTK